MNEIKKQQAIALRLQGKTYGEIMKILNINSKGTLNHWLGAIQLPIEAQQKLQSTISKSMNTGLMRFNAKRTENIKQENKLTLKEATEAILPFSYTELALIGASLYWGEGYKRQSEYRTPQISFGNTDPDMIRIFIRFVKEILQIPDRKINLRVQIHANMQSEEPINFWSKITNIPKDKIKVSRQTSKASRGVRPMNIQPYGTAEIRISSRINFFRIMGYIHGIAKQG